MASGRGDARKLAAEYFRQLGEAGETEIYLPSDAARALGGRRAASVEAGRTGEPEIAKSPDTAAGPAVTELTMHYHRRNIRTR